VAGESARQAEGRDASTLPTPLGIAGNVDESIGGRRWDDLGDELGRVLGQAPTPAFFPLPDQRPRPLVVDDRGTGARKGKPAPGAFGAAPNRPGAGRAASLAQRRAQQNESRAARLAQRSTRPRADRAALREKHAEHVSILGN
jgi:hypothetical protein